MSKSALNTLSERWSKSGIENGDSVLLHSDIRRLLFDLKSNGIKLDLKLIIDSFLNCIGENGTLLIPLFNFGFANGETFDINSTPSKMGILSEYFRRNYNIIRTGHPMYSFGVVGSKKNKFLDLDNYSGYGKDSPFGILRDIKGKIAILDLDDQHSMTFYHYIEEINNVKYRYFKKFSGNYIDKNQKKIKKTYCLFVRKINQGVKTFVNPAGELLWKEGLYNGDKPYVNTGLRTIKSNDLFEFISDIIKSGRAENILYKIILN